MTLRRLGPADLRIVLCVVAAICAYGRALPQARVSGAPVVSTNSGDLRGVQAGSLFVFRGIPYAAPPVGDLRWREPQAVTSWDDVREASAFGNACTEPAGASLANGGDPGPISEDCLYLNVWTPSLDMDARLPVIVWIHGGAYIFGSGSLAIYSGVPLASRGAVFVSINYRLGQLGFFAHAALEKENPGGPANFGLLDQIAALKWVQQNILQFGGDPANVTIMGQSAGAKSVLALFASPLARRLFQKGVVLSSYGMPDATREKAVEVGVKVADALGLPGANATMEELRAMPAERFGRLKGSDLSTAPVPIAGDRVLPKPIQDTFAAGEEAPLPLILGSTSDDASVAAAFGVDVAEVVRGLGAKGLLLKVLYPGVRDERELGRQAARDLVFTMPVRWIADRHSKLASTWRYYFDYTSVNERTHTHGTPHGAEIVYFLDTPDALPGGVAAADREYARKVSGCVFEFASRGKPASEHAPRWADYTSARDETMVFGKAINAQAGFMKARLNLMLGGVKVLGPATKRK